MAKEEEEERQSCITDSCSHRRDEAARERARERQRERERKRNGETNGRHE